MRGRNGRRLPAGKRSGRIAVRTAVAERTIYIFNPAARTAGFVVYNRRLFMGRPWGSAEVWRRPAALRAAAFVPGVRYRFARIRSASMFCGRRWNGNSHALLQGRQDSSYIIGGFSWGDRGGSAEVWRRPAALRAAAFAPGVRYRFARIRSASMFCGRRWNGNSCALLRGGRRQVRCVEKCSGRREDADPNCFPKGAMPDFRRHFRRGCVAGSGCRRIGIKIIFPAEY